MSEVRCPCSRPVPDRLTLCQECGDSVVNALLSVPVLVVELAATRAGLARLVAHANGGPAAEMPSPVRAVGVCARCADPDHPHGPCGKCRTGVEMTGDRQLARLENTITTWARVIAEDGGVCVFVGGPTLVGLVGDYRDAVLDKTGRPYLVDIPHDPGMLPLVPITPLEQAAMWLGQQTHAVRAHRAAHELLVEVLAVTEQIRRLVDRPRELQHVGPCPHKLDTGEPCGTALRTEPDAQWVRCPGCGQQSDVAAVLRATLRRAEPMLFSLDEALALLDRVHEAPARGTVHSWVSRRQLEARAWRRSNGQIVDRRTHRADEPMYKLGEIRALRAAGRAATRKDEAS